MVTVDCRGQGWPWRGGLRQVDEGGVGHVGGGDGNPSGGDGVWRDGGRHHTGPVRAGEGEDVILHDDWILTLSHPANVDSVDGHHKILQDLFSW